MPKSPAIARGPADYETFRIAATDTNRMALIADPIRDKVPFTAIRIKLPTNCSSCSPEADLPIATAKNSLLGPATASSSGPATSMSWKTPVRKNFIA
jgi:hypothetical protein